MPPNNPKRLTTIERLAREIDGLDPLVVNAVAHTICRFANRTCPCADRRGSAKGCCESVAPTAQARSL